MSLLDTYLPDGLHMCNNWDDVPAGQIDSQGNCLSITYLHYADLGQYWGRRIYFPANDGNAIYVNVCSAGVWQGWERIGTATPPQEFSLPLAAGIDAYGKSTYCKTQEGICFVNIAAHSSSDGIMDQSIIATLPAGFRPDMVTYAAGHGFTNAGTRIPLDVEVNPDGTIQIWAASVLEYCSCFVGFVAAS